MTKDYREILSWGKIKPFFKEFYRFNTIDIETIDDKLFILGCTKKDKYYYYTDNFYNNFHDLLISSVRSNSDILTWSRYDNTHLLKLIFSNIPENERDKVLNRIGKISPIYEYEYNGFIFTIENVIKYSVVYKITDKKKKSKNVTIYNLKNLFTTDLENTAKNYEISWYSKLGDEYHIIDRERFFHDKPYQKMVIKSNELDNKVLSAIAYALLENFKTITNVYPKTIFTAGSIARSFLMAFRDEFGDASQLSFKSIFQNINDDISNQLLDYAMRSYHGGKVEVYKIGYIKEGYMTDKNSAYPYALSLLPKLTDRIVFDKDVDNLKKYYYAFIRCNIFIEDEQFNHPIIIKSPTGNINLSPYGYLKNVIITKIEYDYLIENNIKVDIIDYIAVEHENEFPYKKIVDLLIQGRYTTDKKAIADLYKTVVNCLYGITCELTPIYEEDENNVISLKGYRAGDFMNPIIASYITAIVRTDLSNIDNNIIKNGGELILNMTDSIFYNGNITLDIFSKTKVLGKYSMPQKIKNIYVLGTGRYQYEDYETGIFTVKNRGFTAIRKTKGFYNEMRLTETIKIPTTIFVTIFKSTTDKYDFNSLGNITEEEYTIQPFNLGGKRIIKNKNIDLNKEYTTTSPLYLDEYY